jgi:chemotaxis protein histidine kinase CheA
MEIRDLLGSNNESDKPFPSFPTWQETEQHAQAAATQFLFSPSQQQRRVDQPLQMFSGQQQSQQIQTQAQTNLSHIAHLSQNQTSQTQQQPQLQSMLLQALNKQTSNNNAADSPPSSGTSILQQNLQHHQSQQYQKYQQLQQQQLQQQQHQQLQQLQQQKLQQHQQQQLQQQQLQQQQQQLQQQELVKIQQQQLQQQLQQQHQQAQQQIQQQLQQMQQIQQQQHQFQLQTQQQGSPQSRLSQSFNNPLLQQQLSNSTGSLGFDTHVSTSSLLSSHSSVSNPPFLSSSPSFSSSGSFATAFPTLPSFSTMKGSSFNGLPPSVNPTTPITTARQGQLANSQGIQSPAIFNNTDNFIMYDASKPETLVTMKPKKKAQTKKASKIAAPGGDMESFEEGKNFSQGDFAGDLNSLNAVLFTPSSLRQAYSFFPPRFSFSLFKSSSCLVTTQFQSTTKQAFLVPPYKKSPALK